MGELYETYGKSVVRFLTAFLLGLAAGLCLAFWVVLQNVPDYRGRTDSVGADIDRCLEGERRTEEGIGEAQGTVGNLAESVKREGGWLEEGQRILAEIRKRGGEESPPPEEGEKR